MVKTSGFFAALASIVIISVTGPAWGQEKTLSGTLTLSGAWAVYPTAVAWAEAFRAKYPGVRVDVSAGGAGKGAADALAGLVDIGMVSREPDPAEIGKGAFPVYVLHDAVFPVVSDKNPALAELVRRGIKKETWIELYIKGTVTTWDNLTGGKIKRPVHVYTRSDACGAAAAWARFLGDWKQEDLKGVGIFGDPGILEAVRRDPMGIGYSNFSYVFTAEGRVLPGLRVAPVDADANGAADPGEVLESRQAAIKAIESGTYPATRKNYFFVKGKPQGLAKEFIRFALGEEGARVVEKAGTSLPLTREDREKVLRSLE
jgi:phosphate transport system substrate-binding protein